jgi:hypothetical protein
VAARSRLLNVMSALALALSSTRCTTVTETATCNPTSLVLQVSGSAMTPGGAFAVDIADTLSSARLSTRSFDFLVDVLFRGGATGFASAVWIASTPQAPDVTLGFQLGGARHVGSILPIGGGVFGVSTGEGPAISAIGAAGVLMFLGAPSYTAQGMAGQFKVRQAAPLAADVSAQFADPSARPGSFTGQVQVTASGPNCS